MTKGHVASQWASEAASSGSPSIPEAPSVSPLLPEVLFLKPSGP